MAGMMALYRREVARGPSQEALGDKTGQVIDLSLFEPLFRLCIPHIPMYDLLGIVRERVGNDFPDAAPRSLYQTGDNRWLGLSATSQSTWEALAHAMGLSDYITDPRFADNASRLENKDALNEILQQWLGSRPQPEILENLVPAGGVVGPVYGSAQIVEDPHYQDRDDVIEVEDPEIGPTLMPGIIPKFSDTPGAVEHAGPRLGEHNAQVLGSWLGFDAAAVNELADKGVI